MRLTIATVGPTHALRLRHVLPANQFATKSGHDDSYCQKENNKLIKQHKSSCMYMFKNYYRDGFLVHNTTFHTLLHALRIHAHRKSFSAWIILPSARCLDGSFSSNPQSTSKPKLEKLVSHLLQREGRGGRRKDGVLEGL